MKHTALTFAILLASTGPALAQTCPLVTDNSVRFQELVTTAQAAPDEATARALSQEFWDIWFSAPDQQAQELLDEGLARFQAYDFERAVTAYDALIAYCPDYGEGYNQRAFVAFIRENYADAVADLERALERDPDHFAAMAGLAQSLTRLGRVEAAQAMLRRALALNPWLPERHMLVTPPGEEL